MSERMTEAQERKLQPIEITILVPSCGSCSAILALEEINAGFCQRCTEQEQTRLRSWLGEEAI